MGKKRSGYRESKLQVTERDVGDWPYNSKKNRLGGLLLGTDYLVSKLTNRKVELLRQCQRGSLQKMGNSGNRDLKGGYKKGFQWAIAPGPEYSLAKERGGFANAEASRSRKT